MAEQQPMTAEPSEPETVVAASGAVLWRPGASGQPEIAIVHRPRYDDWSLPKGKLDPGESSPHAAVREVAEETGYSCVLSHLLTRVSYPLRESVTKQVDYFAAAAQAGEFHPNNEVDELRWLDIDAAMRELSYPADRDVLTRFAEHSTGLVTLLLVRHAKAGKRSEWDGDDALRPLNAAGQRQSAALRALLPLFGPKRVYSAPRVRCEQTVAGLAADLGVAIAAEPLLSEEGYWPDPAAGMDRLLRIAGGAGTAVVSSQGGVIPDLVSRLAEADGVDIGEVASRKGSLWALAFRPKEHSRNGSGPDLRLVAAYYLANPLPE